MTSPSAAAWDLWDRASRANNSVLASAVRRGLDGVVKLTVRLFAGLRERAGTDLIVLSDLAQPLDVAGLKTVLAETHPELGDLSGVRGVLDTTYVAEDSPLTDGQEVSFLPPVSGGAPSDGELLERGIFELHGEPLDLEAARVRVSDDSCGALLVFTGMTRERNRDQDVRRLDYEAFEAMAGKEMERIFDECNGRFGPASKEGAPDRDLLLRMLTLHRTGAVGVGEPSVVILVASPHRDAAFRAARYLIDELKKRVPLWKKECYADGQHWIGERS